MGSANGMTESPNGISPLPEEKLPFPGIPISRPCLSFWQRTTRNSSLLSLRTTEGIPQDASCIIIGSGLTGSLAALEWLKSNPGDSKPVIMLEAREAVSGATGRNAGHCRPDVYRGYKLYKSIWGPRLALEILRNEMLVFSKIAEFVKVEKVDCDFVDGLTYDVCMGEEFLAYARESWEEMMKDAEELGQKNVGEGVSWLEKEEARRKTRISTALGAYEWQAGSIHPAKLAQHILRLAIDRGLNLQTYTPVTSISPSPTSTPSKPLWLVHTPRGDIVTPIIIHASNAHSGSLLPPSIAKKITPTRAQAAQVVPTPGLSGNNMLTHTYSIRFTLEHFYSLIQRPEDGSLILGTSRFAPNIAAVGPSKDDRTYSQEFHQNALQNFKSCFRSDWEKDGEEVHGEGEGHAWSGIIAMTDDRVPLIGKIPGHEGQWAAVGFGGHGMARIFTCAPGLVQLINGAKWTETGLPGCFEITEERLSRDVKPAATKPTNKST